MNESLRSLALILIVRCLWDNSQKSVTVVKLALDLHSMGVALSPMYVLWLRRWLWWFARQVRSCEGKLNHHHLECLRTLSSHFKAESCATLFQDRPFMVTSVGRRDWQTREIVARQPSNNNPTQFSCLHEQYSTILTLLMPPNAVFQIHTLSNRSEVRFAIVNYSPSALFIRFNWWFSCQ